MRSIAIAVPLAAIVAGPGAAFDIAQCERTTHAFHGGEADHVDHGDGWVSWRVWWSNEGVTSDLHVTDCRGSEMLVSRLREAQISGRDFDRRVAGSEVFDRHVRRSAPLRSLDELAEQLSAIGGETRLDEMTVETCACAAAYPDAGADLPRFELN